MKKCIVLLLAVLTAFSLSACKKDKGQTERFPSGASSNLDSVYDSTRSDGVSSYGAQETASNVGDGSSDTPQSSRVSGTASQVTVSDGSSLGEIEVIIPSVGDSEDGAVTEPNENASPNDGTGGGSPSGGGSQSGGDNTSGGDGGSSSDSASSDADQWTNGYY